MFLTHNDFKLPLQSMLSGAEGAYWSAVEIEFTTPLFLVSFRNPADGGFTIRRTMVFTQLEQVLQMASMGCTPQCEIDAVILLSAKNLNGTENWKTDRLAAVWTLNEPDQPEVSTLIYETYEGQEYIQATLGAPTYKSRERRLLIRFPV